MSKKINLLGYKNIGPGNLIQKLNRRSIKWKTRALEYQAEKQMLQTSVRDVTRSKEKFKSESKALKQELKTTKQELKELKQRYGLSLDEVVVDNDRCKKKRASYSLGNTKKAVGSHYPCWQIQLSIEWYLKSSSGFRSLGMVWSILSNYMFFNKIPSYGVLRHWVFRLGLYKLKSDVEKADDWVYIIDYSIQMGTEYCLLILGFRLSSWEACSTNCLNPTC